MSNMTYGDWFLVAWVHQWADRPVNAAANQYILVGSKIACGAVANGRRGSSIRGISSRTIVCGDARRGKCEGRPTTKYSCVRADAIGWRAGHTQRPFTIDEGASKPTGQAMRASR